MMSPRRLAVELTAAWTARTPTSTPSAQQNLAAECVRFLELRHRLARRPRGWPDLAFHRLSRSLAACHGQRCPLPQLLTQMSPVLAGRAVPTAASGWTTAATPRSPWRKPALT